MVPRGIYTLANDAVLDQLIALLNSIECHAGDLPVMVIPYDGRIEAVSREIASRPNVDLFCDTAVMEEWDGFCREIWESHPRARKVWKSPWASPRKRFGCHRRLCAFSGSFSEFIYLDADTLLLNSPERVFRSLLSGEFVNYDFQFKHLKHVFDLEVEGLHGILSPARIQERAFCSGFFASKRGVFDENRRREVMRLLNEEGESRYLTPHAPDQTILNYMVLRLGIPGENLAHTLGPGERTGNAVTSTHFEYRDHLLFDHGKRLLYLHYIGIPASIFQELCRGSDVGIPYREAFLHYRYLHARSQGVK